LSALDLVFRFKRPKTLPRLIENSKRKFIQFCKNPPLADLMSRDGAAIYDGTHGKMLRHYYVKPPAQVSLLRDLGFTDIRVIDTNSGAEISPESEAATRVRWPYYFCRAAAEA
jgi:hypothetical protein